MNAKFCTVLPGIQGFGLDSQGVGVQFQAGEEILLLYKTPEIRHVGHEADWSPPSSADMKHV